MTQKQISPPQISVKISQNIPTYKADSNFKVDMIANGLQKHIFLLQLYDSRLKYSSKQLTTVTKHKQWQIKTKNVASDKYHQLSL